MRPTMAEILELVPSAIKKNYVPPRMVIPAIRRIIESPTVFIEKIAEMPRPITVNSKDRIGSISKHPERFKMYMMENSKLSTSRSLGMKPMANLLMRSMETKEIYMEAKTQAGVRPSSGVIRRDLNMDRVGNRPASAVYIKRTTVKDLEQA